MKIDTSNWGEFVVGELFPTIVKPPVLHTRQVVESESGLPYVVRTKYDNGIKCRVRPVENVEPSPAGVITWGAENATFFYQPEEFYSGRDIYYIDTRKLSVNACFFLTTCLQTVAHKYPYNFGLFPHLLRAERIKLPVDASGEPDWAYMDVYMSRVAREAAAGLDFLAGAGGLVGHVDTSNWVEFVIGDLFEKLNLRVLNPSFNKTLDVAETPSGEFSLPLVNAKHGNNGIMFYGREADFESAEMTIGIVQNGASATGDVYAHPYKTGVLWDAYLVKPRASIDSEGVLLFLATVIERAIKERFGYHDKCVWGKAKKLTVSLPVTPSGEPDWAYMDVYMSRVLAQRENAFNGLESVNGGVSL